MSGRPATELRRRRTKGLHKAEPSLARRKAQRPTLDYPADLPISRYREQLLAALERHSVIIVCGDTGCGKTTQLPKLCLEAGCGIAGMIGHTQPRRIAARAVAARLAQELDLKLGAGVGFKVRFTDRTHPESLIKVMTDGILLNEIREDRLLSAYDALIVDEAHERSLNIDFILGYLKQLRSRRSDLKIIITSATIDPQRFARHFDGAPVLRVEGRSFPVEMRYRAPLRGEELPDAVVASVRELTPADSAGRSGGRHGDVLVFLPGERWIRDTEQALKRAQLEGFDVLPLYARLVAAQQDRIFHPGHAPRIVLATNMAETSLTVPRIRYVIDSGLARISRYSARHRLQGLAVEPIAQANAAQRAGRCGRLAPGVCIRLYAQEDFEQRPAFMDPEILRTSLAGVILRLEGLKLGPVDDFPFLDAPPTRAVNDAYRLLEILGAVNGERELTETGEIMARLPVDPRVARLLVAAHANGSLAEALVIAAALSVTDPREHPAGDLGAARERHGEFADTRSDFLGYLKLWREYRRVGRRSGKALRSWCEQRYLSLPRLREWEDVHGQLSELSDALGWRSERAGASYKAIHQAVLAAFVDQVAERWEGRAYRGVQDARSTLFPGSGLLERAPRWVVAAERVATERVYLRTVAQVNPRWIAQVAPQLIKREYLEPAWEQRSGRVTVREVLKLHGLTLTDRRRVDYGRIEPSEARDLFIRDALVADDLGIELGFLEHNRAVRSQVLDWEARLRARDLLVGERGQAAFYRARLPGHVRDRGSLLAWIRSGGAPARLEMRFADISTRELRELDARRYPQHLEVAGQALAVRYRYAPGSESDGLTLEVPVVLLEALQAGYLDWLVPGRLEEKVVALLRTLPKAVRRGLVPLPDTAAALLPGLESRAYRQDLLSAVREELVLARGTAVRAEDFDPGALPDHLQFRIEVLDASGAVLAAGRDLRALRQRCGSPRAERGVRHPAPETPWARTALTGWDCPDLPQQVETSQSGGLLKLYPALVDEDGRVDLTLLPPSPASELRHRRGVRRLIVRALPQQAGLIRQSTLAGRELVLSYHGIGDAESLVDDLLCASVESSFALDPPIRTRAEFQRSLERGRAAFVTEADTLRGLLHEVLALHRALRRRLQAQDSAVPGPAREDIERQLGELVFPGFLSATPPEWRAHLPRYLKAAQIRWDKLRERHPKDADFQARVQAASRRLEEWRDAAPPGWPWPAPLVRYRWMLEEFRVSLFAQSLGTALRVSERRLEEAWQEARARSATWRVDPRSA